MSVECVRVALGARAYDIHIGEGLLERAGAFLAPLLHRPRIIVVTDENVAAAQGPRLKSGLEKAAIDHEFIALSPGEETKSFSQLEALTGRLLDLGVERRDLIVAFGGGVIGDLAGFAAAILRRGCRFAQLPTTLLAQVDSAVGGKTAINTVQGKNLIGAFHQPALVLADIEALETLPERELRAGYAEIVKYGLIADPAFFAWLETNGAALIAGNAAARRRAVKNSCAAKAAIVSTDETEENARALLNFGHTFGHAFEAAHGYSDRLLHGEAVALGMSFALDYSVRRGLLPEDKAERAKAHLKAVGLPVSTADLKPGADLSSGRLVERMMQDKKVESGRLTLILARDIGEAMIVKDAPVGDIEDFLKHKTAR